MIGGCFQRNVAFEEDHEDRLWGKKTTNQLRSHFVKLVIYSE